MTEVRKKIRTAKLRLAMSPAREEKKASISIWLSGNWPMDQAEIGRSSGRAIRFTILFMIKWFYISLKYYSA